MVEYLSGGRIQGRSDDSSGAVDALGTAVNGTNDGTSTNASTPIYGQTSVEFDNNEFGKDMGTTSSFATLVGSSWSISFWLHYAGVSGNGWGAGVGSSNTGVVITTGQISSTGNGFVIGLDDNSTQKFYLLIASGQGTSGRSFDDVYTDAIAIHGDKWHHYVFNFDNTNDELKIYRDGSLVQTIAYANTIPTPSATTTSALTMGRQGETDQRFFKGELADVGIFNRLLTTGEMTYLFNSYDPDSATASDNTGKEISTMTNQAGILANYKLDDVNFTNSAASTAKDKSTITNVPVGTRYEETDTRKIYRRKAGGGAAQETNIWGSDYTWSVAGGAAVTTGDDPTGLIHLTQSGGSGNQEYGHTTLTTSANTKTFDFNFTFVRHSGDKANNSYVVLGSTAATPSASSATGTNKYIKFGFSNSTDLILQIQDGDGSSGQGDSNDDNTTMDMQGCTSCTESTETTRYYKILGNGTNVICHRWTSAALRTAWEADNNANTPETSSAAVNFTTNWLARDALDTVSMLGHSGYHTGNWTVKEVSVKFDSGAEDSWVEKGTA